MRKFLIYFSAVLLLLSCSSKSKGVLSEKKMTNVLYEMYLADACNSIQGSISNVDSAKRQSYRYILHKYDVSVADFDSSMVWYSIHPEEQEQLYEKVTLKLQKLQKDVNAGKYKQKIPTLTENDTIEIWQMPHRFDLVNSMVRNRIPFHFGHIQFKRGNALLMTYRLKVNKADQGTDNKLLIKISYAGKTDSLVSHARKDGIWRNYKAYLPLSSKMDVIAIDGWILACSGNDNHQSAIVDNVHCYRITYVTASRGNKAQKHWWQFFKK